MFIFHVCFPLPHTVLTQPCGIQRQVTNSKIEAAKAWVSSSDLASHAAFVRSIVTSGAA